MTVYTREWVTNHFNHPDTHKKAQAAVRDITRLPGIQSVLDFGCGSGLLVDYLTRKGYDAVGCDEIAGNIQFAQEHAQGEFFLDIPFTLKFDCIVMMHVIEHVREPECLLHSLRYHLNIGGYLYIVCPNAMAMRRRLWRDELRRLIYDREHCQYFTPLSLARAISGAGYVVEKMWTRTYPHDAMLVTISSLLRLGKKPDLRGEPIGTPQSRDFMLKLAHSKMMSAAWHPIARLSQSHDSGMELIIVAKRSH